MDARPDQDAEARLADGWLAAAADPEVAAELDAAEQLIADAIEARGPACWASGRCCNFDAVGHRLYVTGLEAARAVLRARALLDAPPLSRASVAAALLRGGCPFQAGHLCGIHPARPTGCRIYFCDRAAQDWQHTLAERVVNLIRATHNRHGIPYRYAEWRALLALFVRA